MRAPADDAGMPIYERPADRGYRRGRYLANRAAAELLTARRAAGISQRELGRHVRLSHSKIGRIERGEPNQLTIEQASKLAAVLGLQFSASLHPDGNPVRDAAHVALLHRFRARLAPSLKWRTEVAMPIEGDRRSADAVVEGAGVHVIVEAETRIDDVQALERRVNGKARDLGIRRIVLLVADTRHNRAVVRQTPELGRRFPEMTRSCLAALSNGLEPKADALVFL
jgi:transcriptional regulator with XRE-family HTH domain